MAHEVRFDASLLKRLRRDAGLTQVALADRAGLDASHICKLESGQRRLPDLPTLIALAHALDVDPDVLVGGVLSDRRRPGLSHDITDPEELAAAPKRRPAKRGRTAHDRRLTRNRSPAGGPAEQQQHQPSG